MVKLFERVVAGGLVLLVACGSALAGTVTPPTSVPEPGTIGLVLAGIAGVAAIRRSRRRK